jgi:hypothetical protein
MEPSLTGGRICNLLLLLAIASAVPLGSESRGIQDHILLSQFFRLPELGGPGPRINISPGTGWPGYTPGHWAPFPPPRATLRATVRAFYPAFTGTRPGLWVEREDKYNGAAVANAL